MRHLSYRVVLRRYTFLSFGRGTYPKKLRQSKIRTWSPAYTSLGGDAAASLLAGRLAGQVLPKAESQESDLGFVWSPRPSSCSRRRVTLTVTPLGVLDDAAGQCAISPVAQIKVLGLVGGPGSSAGVCAAPHFC